MLWCSVTDPAAAAIFWIFTRPNAQSTTTWSMQLRSTHAMRVTNSGQKQTNTTITQTMQLQFPENVHCTFPLPLLLRILGLQTGTTSHLPTAISGTLITFSMGSVWKITPNLSSNISEIFYKMKLNHKFSFSHMSVGKPPSNIQKAAWGNFYYRVKFLNPFLQYAPI